jgi:thiamine biosynthesis lipoprotein
MNTGVQIWLYSHQPEAEAVLADIEGLFHSFEKRLSRFEPDSELSRLNRWPQERFRASPTLIDAVGAALWLAEASGGFYDPTILADLEKAGYDRSFEQLGQPAPLTDAGADLRPDDGGLPFRRAPLTFHSIQVNWAEGAIFKPVGLRLDLGGMGKGWTVDRAADRLQGLGPFLVNAGGDIFAYHSPPGRKGWQVELIHPLKPGQLMATLWLHHRALATSTIAKRRWQQGGKIMHHLIDPRTGQPARTDAISVTVVADRTVVAEVYAKVALILGVEAGLAYLQQAPGVEGLIYTADARIIYTGGLASLLESVEPAGFVR